MPVENEIMELPDLILLQEYRGNFSDYFEAVYEIFKHDFIDSRPRFRGRRLGLKLYPLVDGKEYTFYHMTHEGDIETDRNPDLRRMERIRYPRPLIQDSEHPYLKVWENKRGNKTRVLIWHEAEEYLVILDDRGEFLLPWTAYLVTENHRKRKLRNEYEDYIKSRNRQ